MPIVLSSLPSPPAPKKKLKISLPESDETRNLSTSDLQRMLILKQLNLTNLQIEKETLLLERLKKGNVFETTNSENELLTYNDL